MLARLCALFASSFSLREMEEERRAKEMEERRERGTTARRRDAIEGIGEIATRRVTLRGQQYEDELKRTNATIKANSRV